MEDIVFPKKYRSKKSGRIVIFINHTTGMVVSAPGDEYMVGFYGRWTKCTDTSAWEPVEEEPTVSEKEPFPAFEDIEWVMVEAPEWYRADSINNVIFTAYEIKGRVYKYEYERIKDIYEHCNSFEVKWKLKEKINRKLHENKPLAMAIGRWLINHSPIQLENSYSALCAVSDIFNSKRPFRLLGTSAGVCEATLPDDYEIPEQVLQWMKEYEKETE